MPHPDGSELRRAGPRPAWRVPVVALLVRTAVFAALWWVVAEGRSAWAFGLPAAALAALASLALQPSSRHHVRPLAALRLLRFFLWRSLLGSIDVAGRALRPRMPLRPAFEQHVLRVATPGARVLLVDLLSLMPGTLSVALQGDALLLHVLDTRLPIERDLRRLEQLVAALFGASLPEPAPPPADGRVRS
jgi:multicomponent Na+:H+ antiporter subunit E